MSKTPKWSDRMPLKDKLKFFRDTGEWPGRYGEVATTMFMQGNIEFESRDGKDSCAERKLQRAEEAGLKIKLP